MDADISPLAIVVPALQALELGALLLSLFATYFSIRKMSELPVPSPRNEVSLVGFLATFFFWLCVLGIAMLLLFIVSLVARAALPEVSYFFIFGGLGILGLGAGFAGFWEARALRALFFMIVSSL